MKIAKHHLPDFSKLQYNTIENKLTELLEHSAKEINRLLDKQHTWTWENLIEPIENHNECIHQYWGLIQHLHAVINSKELRVIYHRCLPKLSDYHTQLSHNKKYYQAIRALKDSTHYQSLNTHQYKVIDNQIRDFKRAGIYLSKMDQATFATLSKTLSQLTTQFEVNILDASQAFYKHVTNKTALTGIPNAALSAAQHTAKSHNLNGYVFTLEMPSYLAIMTHAESETLRAEIYKAFVTRASDQGPNMGKWDNQFIINDILKARLALSQLLGFKHYADYALEIRMVKEPESVISFLTELTEKTLPQAKKEYQLLQDFAKQQLNLKELFAWDIMYASEKFKHHRYHIAQENLRPYFPAPKVLQGLFQIVKRLFGIDIQPINPPNTWHPDVQCFVIYDHANELRGYFYLDLYARPNKRNGAWMDDYQPRRSLKNNTIQKPIAFIVCNLNPPIGSDPALLSHDDVVTLFHEFGHTLQHVLTRINYAEISGINGIPWDAIELASQCLEYWAWEKECIPLISGHYQTGKLLPNDNLHRLHQTKNFQSGMSMMRQITFALYDIQLHIQFSPNEKNQAQMIFNEIQSKIGIYPIPRYNRFQNSFSHIFAGGYAAGYYSYKWAEVMAADAFSLFQEKGIFDPETAQTFQSCLLESGGAEKPAVLFERFRGRQPTVDSLLQQSNITLSKND